MAIRPERTVLAAVVSTSSSASDGMTAWGTGDLAAAGEGGNPPPQHGRRGANRKRNRVGHAFLRDSCAGSNKRKTNTIRDPCHGPRFFATPLVDECSESHGPEATTKNRPKQSFEKLAWHRSSLPDQGDGWRANGRVIALGPPHAKRACQNGCTHAWTGPAEAGVGGSTTTFSATGASIGLPHTRSF